jgi:hypothetical protein
MESSTIYAETKELKVLDQSWERLETGLGMDLEKSAREMKAFLRVREIPCARELLRIGMVFGMQDWSFEQIALWALSQGIGNLSGVAIRQRLLNCEGWLRELVGQVLRKRCSAVSLQPGWKVRLQDATTISRPGSSGTDGRVHLELDLANLCVTGVEVTDAHGGESLARFEARPDEIRVGDRGHAFASGMEPILKHGYLVVRINWQNLPLYTLQGERFDLITWLRSLAQASETTIQIQTPQGWFSLRLHAAPLSPEKAEAARRRARHNAQKKHHQVQEGTLVAAGFLLLVTNLPKETWPSEIIFWLYRLRWQIELQFKRYKSLLNFAQIRSKDPTLIQVCLLCKILAILFLDELIGQVRLQQPDWFLDPKRPVSLWRLTQYLWNGLCTLICGSISLSRFFTLLPALARHFRSAPRKRQQQLAWALALLDQQSIPSFFVC